MRFLVKATIPVEAGNALVQDPRFGKRLEEIIQDLKPETVYFAIEGGQRTMYFIVNVADVSQTPAIAEPLWLLLQANVEFIPVMNQADMAKAAPAIARAAQKYAPGAATTTAVKRSSKVRETAGRSGSHSWSA